MFNIHKVDDAASQAEFILNALNLISKRLQEAGDLSVTPEKAIEWLTVVFKDAVKVSDDGSYEPDSPQPLNLTKQIAAFIIQTVIRILSARSDLQDNSLYYLNDTGIALGIHPREMRNLLDQEFNKLRYEFTVQLKQELDPEKRYWCALMLMKIICADGQIHPEEKLFFDIIEELIKDSKYNLSTLKSTALGTSTLPKLKLNQKVAHSMLKYVVTIAMCDGEYVGQESQFIKQAAESLDIQDDQIDQILQPVASSFMVLESLFPRGD